MTETRKLAYILIILLIAVTVLVTVAVIESATATNLGVTNTVTATAGAIFAPLVTWIKESWVFVGTDFAYISAATLGISIIGGLFMVFIAYGLIWQRLIQSKLLHKVAPTPAAIPMQRTISTPIQTAQQLEPQPAPLTQVVEPAKEEA